MPKKPATDIAALFSLLGATVRYLDAARLDYIMDYGGALGLLRTGQFIPWDTDLDISVPVRGENHRRRLMQFVSDMRARHYNVRTRLREDRIIVSAGGQCIDIFLWRPDPEEDGAWTRPLLKTDRDNGKGGKLFTEWIDETEVKPFRPGVEKTNPVRVRVPVDLEGLVEHRYGKNWRYPETYFPAQHDYLLEHGADFDIPDAADESPQKPSEAAEDDTRSEETTEDSEAQEDADAFDPEAVTAEDLPRLSLEKLKAVAKAHKIKGYSKLAKDELAAYLEAELE